MKSHYPYNPNKPKLLYIENLRILLSALVVIVHVACTYGGPGGWSYMEKGAGLGTRIPLTVLNATAQSFFMGMFFFIGAYFTHKSLTKKGFGTFLKERLIRLGIPTLLTYFFISVITAYIIWPVKYPNFEFNSFAELWLTGKPFSFGVMWFVLALSYFTVLYLISYYLIPALRRSKNKALPQLKPYLIILSAVLVGVVTFLVRIKYPLFKWHGSPWLPFDLGHFPQYIFLFILGIMASRYSNDNFVIFKHSKNWLWFVLVLIVVIFPLLFFIGEAHKTGIRAFAGRGTWHSLAYAIWEQLIGFAIIAGLLGFSKVKWNMQNKFLKKLSDSAYAVYVLHPPVLVGISLLFINWKVMLLIKFLAITPLALVGSFGIAMLVKNLPLLKKVF